MRGASSMMSALVQVVFLLAVSSVLIQTAAGEGTFDILFDSYHSDCGNCDPKFTFCVDRPSSSYSVERSDCYYGIEGESDHYHDTGSVYFGDSIKGISNPWLLKFGTLKEKQIMVVARTRDDDWFGSDHMATWGGTFTETVYPTAAQAVYASRTIKQNDHELAFKIRIYCTSEFYGWDCGKKCAAPGSDDHYTCDEETGDKKCDDGWEGDECDKDINECDQDPCERGECKNLPGSYECHCPENFSGQTCSIMGDPCAPKPCLNNGTCVPYENEYQYTCECVEPYHGQDCQVRRDPCESDPCLHDGKCLSSEDNTTFSCNCTYLFSGEHCEIEIEQPTTIADTSTIAGPGSDGQGQRLVTEDSSTGGFLWWHGLMVGLILIIILLAAILFLLLRRRRRKEKMGAPAGLPPGDAVMFDGNALAFENSMYAGRTSNANGGIRQQHPPLPDTPTDDDMTFPVKPMREETLVGAVGGYNPEEAGYMKPSETVSKLERELKAQDETSAGHLDTNLRAQDNAYSDLNAIRASYRVDPERAEPHYQDLDEIRLGLSTLDGETRDSVRLVESSPPALNNVSPTKLWAGLPVEPPLNNPDFSTFSGYSLPNNNATVPATTKENPYSEPHSSPEANAGIPSPPVADGIKETAYSDTPRNHPAPRKLSVPPLGLPNDINTYSPIEPDAEFDFALAQRVAARRNPSTGHKDNLYAEPVSEKDSSPPPIPPLPRLSSDASQFANQTYTDIPPPRRPRRLSNPVIEDGLHDDEDDIPPFGGLPLPNVGYASPKGSFSQTLKEPVYSDPTESPQKASPELHMYDSPRSSAEHSDHKEPPQVSPRPPGYGNAGYEVPDSFPPLPSLPLPQTPHQLNGINGMGETSFRIGQTARGEYMEPNEPSVDDDNKANSDKEKARQAAALFINNGLFEKD